MLASLFYFLYALFLSLTILVLINNFALDNVFGYGKYFSTLADYNHITAFLVITLLSISYWRFAVNRYWVKGEFQKTLLLSVILVHVVFYLILMIWRQMSGPIIL